MNWEHAFSASDPRLLETLAGLLELPAGTHPANGVAMATIRTLTRRHGISVQIIPGVPIPDSPLAGRSGPVVVVCDGQFLFLRRRVRGWCVRGHGGVEALCDKHALARFFRSHDEGRRVLEAWDWLRGEGVGRGLASEFLESFSLEEAEQVIAWLRSRGRGGQSATRLIRLAVRDRDLLPVSLPLASGQAPSCFHLRFRRHLPLADSGSIWGLTRRLARAEVFYVWAIALVVSLGLPLGYLTAALLGAWLDLAGVGVRATIPLLGAIIATVGAMAVLGLLRSLLSARLGARLRLRLSSSYVFRVIFSRIDRLRSLPDGDIVTRLSDLFFLQSLVFDQALPGVFAFVTVIGACFYLVTTLPNTIAPVLAAVGLAVVGFAVATPPLKQARRLQLEAGSLGRERLRERMESRRTFRLYDTQDRLLGRLDQPMANLARRDIEAIVIQSRLGAWLAATGLGLMAIVAIWAHRNVVNGSLSLGQALVGIGVATTILQGTLALGNLTIAGALAKPSLERLRAVFDATEPEPFDDPTTQPGGSPPEGWRPAHLRLKGVSFRWPHRTETLRDISLEIAPGEWVALIGPSGSGKSSIAAVLGGLVEPAAGEILLDGVSIRSYSPGLLRERIALVTQEVFLFDRTMRENIVLGQGGVSDELIEQALGWSDLKGFVDRLARGLDHFVGEDGSRISTGEKVRIGLARALVRRPGLLVLDEALARLDEIMSGQIVSGLRASGTSVLLLTHDLARVRHCDRIYVLEEGRILDHGRFDELSARPGPFRDILEAKREAWVPAAGSELS